jgi:hypothetical protein
MSPSKKFVYGCLFFLAYMAAVYLYVKYEEFKSVGFVPALS